MGLRGSTALGRQSDAGVPPYAGRWLTVLLQEQGVRVDIDSVDWVATREFRSAARMCNQTLRCLNERIWRLLEIGDSR